MSSDHTCKRVTPAFGLALPEPPRTPHKYLIQKIENHKSTLVSILPLPTHPVNDALSGTLPSSSPLCHKRCSSRCCRLFSRGAIFLDRASGCQKEEFSEAEILKVKSSLNRSRPDPEPLIRPMTLSGKRRELHAIRENGKLLKESIADNNLSY